MKRSLLGIQFPLLQWTFCPPGVFLPDNFRSCIKLRKRPGGDNFFVKYSTALIFFASMDIPRNCDRIFSEELCAQQFLFLIVLESSCFRRGSIPAVE